MKKVTLLFMLLCSLITHSQILVDENFETVSNGSAPSGWTTNDDWAVLGASFFNGWAHCGSKFFLTFAEAGASTSFTTSNLVAASNGTDMTVTFDYKIVDKTSIQFGTAAAPVADWGSLVFEYTTNGTDWTAFATIDDSNYTYSTSCQSGSYTIAGANVPADSDFQVRATLNVVNTTTNSNIFVTLDNLSFAQSATEVPNCDVTLTSETTDVFVDTTITWSGASGLPTGYYVSVGTESGVYNVVDNVDALTATSYALTDLEYNTTYYVLISPYNAIGTASCTEFTFTTVDAVAPNCDAAMTSATTNVPINTTITWSAATGYPTGYNIAMGYTAGDYTVVASTDAGNTTSFPVPVTLEYSTTYYVLITPYNEFGNATDCTVYSFVTRDAPIQGAICEDPIVIDIDAGDYSATAVSLDAYEDNYNDAPCNAGSGSTMAGNEIVYALAPLSDVSVDIAVTNIVNQRANIYLLDSCVDVAEGCIASAATGYGTPYVDLLLEEQVLLADNIYYIVISTNSNATENNTQFDLNITANDCIIPSASLTPVPDCGNGEYSVEVDVTYFGSGTTTLTISDGVNEDQTLSAAGQVTFGPYDNASMANFTITSDLGCSISDSISYYCVPTNNECSTALTLEVSTDDTCDNKVEGYTNNATFSADNTCNTSYRAVWYSFTPTESAYYKFTVTNTGTTTPATRISLYSGSCGSLVEANCGGSTSVTESLTANTEYLVTVQTYGENEAETPGMQFDLCAYQVPVIPNNDCTDAIEVLESDATGSINTISGSLENAFNSVGGCGTEYVRHAWYTFTPQYTGTYHANFTGSTSSVYFVMYNTDDCSGINDTAIISDLSGCYSFGGQNDTQDFSLTAGTTYIISTAGQGAYTYEFYIYPDASLSTEDVNFEGFRYYPNPVKNTLTFESPNMISSVAIYNVVGQRVLATAENNTMSTVNMGALPNGIYFAKVNIDGAEKTIKIIKE